MKKFLFLILIVGLLVLGGWAAGVIKFSGNENTATVEIDKQRFQDVSDKVKGKMVEEAEKVKEKTQNALNKIETKSSTSVTTTTTVTTETK